MGTFTGKTLMITGGTGSFGNAVLDRFLDTDIGEIRIFSRDEKKQDDMRKKYKNDKLRFYIGDVREKQSVVNAIHGVDYIFHAAALKQVPSCEFFPMEAVKTNIIGTNNVLEAADILATQGIEATVLRLQAVAPLDASGVSYGGNIYGQSKTVVNVYGGKIKVYDTEIPHSVRAAEISAAGKSIYEHDPKGKVAEAYRNLTKEVLKNAEIARKHSAFEL